MGKAVAVILGSVLFALALGEGLLRLVADPPLYQRFSAQIQRSEMTVKGAPEGGWMGGLYQATPSGRRLRPRVDGVIKNHSLSGKDISLRTNRLGFRGREWDPLQRPLVVFLGDSITLGDYLPEEQTFVAQVEGLAKGEGLTWQAQNAGVGSIGVQTELAILKEVAPRIRPDAVVLNLYLNDIQPSPVVSLIPLPPVLGVSWIVQYGYQAASHLQFITEEGAKTTIEEDEWKSWRSQARRTVRSRLPPAHRDEVEKKVIDNFRDWGAAWSPSALRRVYEVVLKIREESHRYGAPLFVVMHPVRFQVEYPTRVGWPQEKLGYWFRGDRIPYLDLLPRLRAAHFASREPLFYDQCHHRPAGADLVSMEIFHFLNSYGIRRSYFSVTSDAE